MIKSIQDSEIWDRFLEENPFGQLFHQWKFLKILERHSGFDLLPLGFYSNKNNKLICIIPFFFKKYGLLKLYTSSPPKSGIPNLNLVLDKSFNSLKQHNRESYMARIVSEFDNEFNLLSPDYISFSLSGINDVRQFRWNGYYTKPAYTYKIDLNKSIDNIWNEFDRDCRREIRSTERFNLTLKETSDIDAFYNIMINRYKEQGLNFPFFGQQYFRDILSTFPENVKLYFLLNDGLAIDVLVTYQYNGRIVFWKGFVNLDRHIHSNEYLTWAFVKKAKENDFLELEIQGANTDRLCLFKSKFNPSLELYFNLYKKSRKGNLAEKLYIWSKKKSFI